MIELLWSTSETVNARAFKPYPLCSAPLKTYFSRDFWSSRNQLMLLLKHKLCFEKMLWGTSEMVNARAFKYFAIMFSTPKNLLVGISGALGTREIYFLSKSMF